MDRVKIKPLTVNQAWQGRRFKSPKYKAYIEELMEKLPPKPADVDFDKELVVKYTFYLSSPLSDWDNPIKPFQDVLSAKWEFNDRLIMRAIVDKIIVKKGEEKIDFSVLNKGVDEADLLIDIHKRTHYV